jgi:uncharacterized protein (DUF58 family)
VTRKEILSGLWEFLFIVLMLVGLGLVSPFIMIVGIFGFFITIGARIWSRLSLEDVVYERDLPDHAVFVGDEFDIEIRVTNAKPIPMPWLRIADTVPIGLEVMNGKMARSNSRAALELRESINLAWYERVRLKYSVKALRRGYHQMGPAMLDSGVTTRSRSQVKGWLSTRKWFRCRTLRCQRGVPSEITEPRWRCGMTLTAPAD